MAAPHSSLLPQIKQLLHTQELPALGPKARSGAKSAQQLRTDLSGLLDRASLSAETRQLTLGAALFWHDHLDDAHTIAQDISSSEGSWLHAIMHRREPDYGNSKYWYRRVGSHPAFSEIGARVKSFLETKESPSLTPLRPDGTWDPFAFVDACERAAQSSAHPHIPLLQEIQRIEFDTFLEHLTTGS